MGKGGVKEKERKRKGEKEEGRKIGGVCPPFRS